MRGTVPKKKKRGSYSLLEDYDSLIRFTAENARDAALTVCEFAHSIEEAKLFLHMLGIWESLTQKTS